MKIFLDTNVWLSATLFSGLCEALILRCATEQTILTTPLVREEAIEVLLRKFPHLPEAPLLFDASWCEACCVPDVPDPADDSDARLVAAACAADADIFVTGDKRVQEWNTVNGMKIFNPREAWVELFSLASNQ